ncbi:MAG TPA: hypothetical protein VE775_08985 [Pyrinomonadaceae bacterium]|nr:hypothetical protein [Pyrinomonadaceae bacterium]
MKHTMKKSMLAATLFALALIASATVVSASTTSECQQLIASLKTETQSVILTGKSAETKDRPGLIGKLDNASLALDRAKFCDSIQKLNDFKAKINQLIAAGQINQNPTDANGAPLVTGSQLLADADAAINCINQLATQSGTACF